MRSLLPIKRPREAENSPPTSMAALEPSSWNHLPCATERVRKELRVSWRDEER